MLYNAFTADGTLSVMAGTLQIGVADFTVAKLHVESGAYIKPINDNRIIIVNGTDGDVFICNGSIVDNPPMQSRLMCRALELLSSK